MERVLYMYSTNGVLFKFFFIREDGIYLTFLCKFLIFSSFQFLQLANAHMVLIFGKKFVNK